MVAHLERNWLSVAAKIFAASIFLNLIMTLAELVCMVLVAMIWLIGRLRSRVQDSRRWQLSSAVELTSRQLDQRNNILSTDETQTTIIHT
jgi:hypothetical protein